MEIPEQYQGNLQVRVIQNHNLERGRIDYYPQLRSSEQEWRSNGFIKSARDIKYFFDINIEFFEKLRQAIKRIEKGKLEFSDLESFLLSQDINKSQPQ